MKPKYIKAHMEVAGTYARLSTARRLQVGAIVVKDDRIISIGYNGMPSGWDNNCEDEVVEIQPEYGVGSIIVNTGELKTKPEVLHAEANAIAKVARSPESSENAVIFVTHAPCIECAKLIYQSGIKQVFYRDNYRSEAGVAFLKQAGITINKVEE
jgi:dCMP deaminase